MIEPERLMRILGKEIADPEIETLKKQLGHCEVDDFDGMVTYAFYDYGCSMNFYQSILGNIQLYSKGVEHYEQYPDPLPHSLRFSFKSADVHAALGKPTKTGPDTD